MKKAFSLIEVVLALIVVAIVSVSIPIIIKQTNVANTKALTQESILNAKTYMSLVLKSAFTCDYISENENTLVPIFNDTNFYESNFISDDGRRNFQPKTGANLDKACPESITNIKSIANFTGNVNMEATKERDYILSSTYNVTVSNFNSNNDIKRIDIKTKAYDKQSHETEVTLSGFAVNIGDSGLLNTKEWQ
ncbi:prepilin-type N-terminal cleavage/methylation domain-containing protein [Campylobacter sp. RM13119]|uniref:prepilin-type N-terminal cleavage/methylation domain-containing protein n=1 Tax=Campylobacter californiensis TaxID=1032243 RepID=UPI00147525FD|nr:prepilin-type N-terminal cleavage/methylation domain-containing protein [Campylobacter sp. RM13119]MBE3605811.1 prepilin-type N-terminal cleavage/methylation domain-containing protein [Campylobacter sp. RM13119]